jgi:hypothetical protein
MRPRFTAGELVAEVQVASQIFFGLSVYMTAHAGL